MQNDDGSKRSASTSHGRSRSTSRGSSSRSRSASSSRSVVNHHMEEQGKASPCHPKRTHSYSDDDDGHHHLPLQDSGSIYATFAAPSKKYKKARRPAQDGLGCCASRNCFPRTNMYRRS
jgi:hypothetical protein